MELPSWIVDHINLYKTDPEKAHFFDASFGGGKPMTPTLLLTMKGRKSGRDISTPLIYGKHGSAYVVIASKGGAPDHPDWYKNLVANPMCHIQVGKQAYRADVFKCPDGKQFVVTLSASEDADQPAQMRITLNWFEELKQRVPAQ